MVVVSSFQPQPPSLSILSGIETLRLLDVFIKLFRHKNCPVEVRITQCLSPMQRKLPGRRDHIANLPSVDLLPRQHVPISPEVLDVDLLAVGQCAAMLLLELADEVIPDSPAVSFVQGWIVECQLNTRLEGLVEYPNAVGGQDQNTPRSTRVSEGRRR